MYKIKTRNRKIKKVLEEYISLRNGIKDKLKRLKENPQKENGTHPLKGPLAGKWACWLGSNIRMIYKIDDSANMINVESVGSHKIY
ncbi:MAG: type II toxin-antitoxin system mRNA interferase toxin, RelE/StbE family [Nanoarchaeota archaeon]|nr:type II toxin-antitoxin system mRNA interferase toxin, RelE/StbE family [Nanoarchaeota archaeon]MBU1501295.1 type II toxin-antitoxin system mRNA interferase toxin, RelE/StbE family [Nanoarchaeota archaeon]